MEQILLGIMTAAWVFTVGGVGYAIWRYVYAPWKTMRADIRALNDEIVKLKQNEQLRKVLTLDPEDEYRAEIRAAARRLARSETS